MKKVFLAALFFIGITAFAQEKEGRKMDREKLTPEQKVDFQVKRMSADLNLNEKQVADVKALVAKEVQKREAKRAEMKENKAEARKDMRAQMEADQAAMSADMKKILTAEQYAKWEKIRDERKEKMKEKMMERMEKKDADKFPDKK
jgi:hypothetical protein